MQNLCFNLRLLPMALPADVNECPAGSEGQLCKAALTEHSRVTIKKAIPTQHSMQLDRQFCAQGCHSISEALCDSTATCTHQACISEIRSRNKSIFSLATQPALG